MSEELKIDIEFARRDDCLDRMVPSDLRMLVSERDHLRADLSRLKAGQGEAVAIEVIGYASPGQVEILRNIPRTGGMKVRGSPDKRYTEPVVLLSAARSAVFAAVIRCDQAGAFKVCMECGYQDGHDPICQYHKSKRAADDPVAIVEYAGYEPANSLKWLNKGLAYMDPGAKLYASPPSDPGTVQVPIDPLLRALSGHSNCENIDDAMDELRAILAQSEGVKL